VQHFRAVGEQRGRSLAGIEPARIHFPDVGDEISFDSPRLLQKLGQSAEERVVRDPLQRVLVFHADNIGGLLLTSRDRVCATLRPTISFEASRPIARSVVGASGLTRLLLRTSAVPNERAPKSCQEESAGVMPYVTPTP